MSRIGKVWSLFDHFCDLLASHHAILNEEPFVNFPTTSLSVSQKLFEDFKQYTTHHRDYKGFPTRKGHKKNKSLLPKNTTMPKNHEGIVKMFNNFFNAKKSYIQEKLEEDKKNGPTIAGVVEVVECDKDDNEQELSDDEVVVDTNDEDVEKKSYSVSNESVTSIVKKDMNELKSKQRKISDIQDYEIEEKPLKIKKKELVKQQDQQANLCRGAIITIKKEAKQAIDIDTESQDKNMTQTKLCVQKIEQVLEETVPIIEKEAKELQQRKEKVLAELQKEEERIKLSTGLVTTASQFKEHLVGFIHEKEIEFAKLEQQEEENLNDFYANLFKNSKQ